MDYFLANICTVVVFKILYIFFYIFFENSLESNRWTILLFYVYFIDDFTYVFYSTKIEDLCKSLQQSIFWCMFLYSEGVYKVVKTKLIFCSDTDLLSHERIPRKTTYSVSRHLLICMNPQFRQEQFVIVNIWRKKKRK